MTETEIRAKVAAADKEKLDGINISVMIQAQYDALSSPDANPFYLIPEVTST